MFTKENAEAYFVYSKTIGLVFLIIGAAAILVAGGLCIWGKTPLLKGVALGLILMSIFQLFFGYKEYSQSDSQRKAVIYQMSLDPESVKNKALIKAHNIARLSTYATYAFITIGITGLLLLIKFGYITPDINNNKTQLLKGIGIGILLQSVLCLMGNGAFDIQTRKYIKGLNSYLNNSNIQ